jgi:CubicO group peptidase (beta-lactamase class C family)
VVKEGKLVFVQAEGFADLDKKIPMTRNTIFPVASLTKTFASVVMAQYVQEGKVSDEDYILDYPYLSVGFSPERLSDPNVKIKHVLSHTSEGIPGSNYIYNGSRYNLIYGVYEKVTGNTHHYDAFAQEVRNRIIGPLKLQHTYPGYPSADQIKGEEALIARTYKLDPGRKTFSDEDKNENTWTTLFPATNLLTTLDDLAVYTTALDNNQLISAESYKKITSPFIANSGRVDPYGLGWGTQNFEGQDIHWHYGYGDSFAALIVRVPREKISFIFFSNAVPPSETFLLGYGNVLNSPFALSFLKNMVSAEQRQPELFNYRELTSGSLGSKKSPMLYNEVFSQALMRYYAEQTFETNKGEAAQLLNYLVANNPERFKKEDISLIWLLAKLANPALKDEIEITIRAYQDSSYFHPEIHEQIAIYYQKIGNAEKSLYWYHLLADSHGFEEQQSVRNACVELGKHYLGSGEKEKGRRYLWREVVDYRYTDSGIDDAEKKVKMMLGN